MRVRESSEDAVFCVVNFPAMVGGFLIIVAGLEHESRVCEIIK
jgi:hypothetical protein